MKRKKLRAPFCLYLDSGHFIEKNSIEGKILLVQDPVKSEKIVSFDPIFTLIFPIFGEHQKGIAIIYIKKGWP